jgi:hypothetical protein
VLNLMENGVALQAASLSFPGGLTDGEYGLSSDRSGCVIRASISGGVITRKAWLPGFSNIATVWQAGFMRDGEKGATPADLVQACCELSWLMFREGARNGLETLIQQGVNVSFVRMLSPKAQQIVDSYTLPRSPVTIEA